MAATKGQHLIGKMLGSCVLEQLLGSGGSSTVFLAQQTNPMRKVAVKVFLPRANMDAQMRKDFYVRFLREAEAVSRLHHPNILPIYSYGEQEGLPYIVMPYMVGGTLSEYIAKRSPLSLQAAQWYLEQIAAALDYAHRHGCIHCDVKPANILLESNGRAMLSDFGIAQLMHPTKDQAGIKLSDGLTGTPNYISPEQALGRPLDGRSDIYSLGITLFYLLTKRLPFDGDTTIAVALLHIRKEPPSLSFISPSIDLVVRKALAKNPDERFQTPGEFSAAFAQAIAASQHTVAVAANGNHVLLPGRPASLGDGFVPASKPRVSPIRWRSFGLLHFLGLAALILMVVSATVLTKAFVASSFVSGASSIPNSISHGATVDYLVNQKSQWPVSSTFFYDDHQRYHIVNQSPQQNIALALYSGYQVSDFRLTVTMLAVHTVHDDADYYGVVFRASPDQSRYYVFEIVPSGVEQYQFLYYSDDGRGSYPWRTIAIGTAPSLLTHLGSSNTITVEARGHTFSFLINGKLLGKPVTDPSKLALQSGEIGLYVEQQDAEVAFSHLYVDSLK